MRSNIMKKAAKAVLGALLCASVTLTGSLGMNIRTVEAASTAGIGTGDFLKTDGKLIRKNYGTGDTVYLRGTNAGGYLLQEFWMCQTNYSDQVKCEMDIYRKLTERFGEAKMRELVNGYQDNYWTEADFDNCAGLGINCIRLPIWYLNLVDFNGNLLNGAFDRIDWFVQEAGERGIYVILDMHGAPGSQNGSDHSGVDGGADKQGASQFFWGGSAAANQQKYYDLWRIIAERYKNNPTVAGYDLLNEPYCTYRYSSGYSDQQLRTQLWNIYDKAYDVIRGVDQNHIIIMEATWDAVDLPDPSSYGWSNVMYEYHNYNYSDYDNAGGTQISSMRNKINGIQNANYNVPSYIGEFCYFDNTNAWKEGIQLLNDAGLNWTTWTYKTTDNYGNWGLFHHPSDNKVNIEWDSQDQIKSKWARVQTSSENTALTNAIRSYFPGVNQKSDSATIENGTYYLTSIANQMVVCAENGGESPLQANRSGYGGAWESLVVENNSDGTISLKSESNQKYVCAVLDEQKQLLPRSSAIGTWEKFRLVKINDTQYGIQSAANGKYVKADLNDNGILKADSDKIGGAWEAFTFTGVSGNTPDEGEGENGGDTDFSQEYGVIKNADGTLTFYVHAAKDSLSPMVYYGINKENPKLSDLGGYGMSLQEEAGGLYTYTTSEAVPAGSKVTYLMGYTPVNGAGRIDTPMMNETVQ